MQTPTSSTSLAAAGEYLSFRLGAEEYGIDILCVQEIRGYEAPTRIAGAPDFILGVVNLRGAIVPIVDLRIQFRLRNTGMNAGTVVIILHVAGRVIGIVVDAVSDVLALAKDCILPAPEFTAMVDSAHVRGLGRVPARQGQAERMLILTDIEALLSSADLRLVQPERALAH